MKFLLISCLVALAAADVSHLDEKNAQILRSDAEVNGDGSYQWAYETSNGINAQAQGQLKGAGEEAAVAATGQFSFKTPEGEQVSIQYVADENGYQPQGSHLPTPPPIPEEILKSLEYIRNNPPHPDTTLTN